MPFFSDPLQLASFIELQAQKDADTAPSGRARIWFDAPNNVLRISLNTGAYAEIPTLLTDSITNADLIQAIVDGAFQADAATRALFGTGIWTSAYLNETTIQYALTSLTNAQMLNLRATPIELVAAPGAGKMLQLERGFMAFDYTAAYTETADNMAILWGSAGSAASETIEATGFVDATADTGIEIAPRASAAIAKTAMDNKSFVLHNTGDGEYGGGNAANVMRVFVAYRVLPLGW